jgi:RimJ/RimL family protein N-acetyltransferase
MSRCLNGEFVTLRPLTVADAELTLRWRSSPRARLLNRGASTLADQAAWIAGLPDDEHNFVIETLDAIPVGTLSLVDVNHAHRRAQTGRFLIGDPAAVRNIPAAVEAMALVYGLAFDELELERIHGTVVAGNRRMVAWQRYLGMREEGVLRRHLHLDGRWHDAVCFGLLEEEYRAETAPRLASLIAMGRTETRKEAA